jgi:predicted PurR-regulated permease PerM
VTAIRSSPILPFIPPASTLSTLLFGVVIVAALYFGREVLVPVALAVLMSFVLAPLVRILHGWRVPRSVAVIFVVLISFAAIFAIGAVMFGQMNQLAGDLPRYQSTLREKIQSVRGVTGGSGTLEKAAEVLEDLGEELKNPSSTGKPRTGNSRTGEPGAPIPVEIRHPTPSALQTIGALMTPLLSPLATTGIVFILVIFILLYREDLRNRVVRLAGVKDLQRTTAALDEAGQRLSRLFLTQLGLNAAFGMVIGAGLFLIGVPSAPLWGILAMVLRFVPYIGAVIAAIFPLVLAAAVGPDWSMVIWTAILFAVVEPLTGHVIEPLLTGHSSGLSPVAVVAAAVFWTWLWGPIGLVLATPLTVCLMVIGRHVDRLKFLDVMFGDEPVLTPTELVYQRMLAGDAVETADQAELYLQQDSLQSFYENVLVQSLRLAHTDFERGDVDEERLARMRSVAAEIVDDLSVHKDLTPKPSKDESSTDAIANAKVSPDEPTNRNLAPGWQGDSPVLCVPGHGPLDDTLALIVAQLVRRHGLGSRAEAANALSMTRIFSLETEGVALICVCYLAARPAEIRYAIKRLRRRFPEAIVMVCLPGQGEGEADQPLAVSEDIAVVRSLSSTVQEILEISRFASQDDKAAKQSEKMAPA